MKKIICLILSLVLCLSLAAPVLAEEEFVPSVTYKGHPSIVPVEDEQGRKAIGTVNGEDGEIMDYIYDCLLVTSVADAQASTEIPAAAKETLLSVYAKLSDGSMVLPYGDDVDADAMVIKDLFDISWLCEEHPTMVAPAGVTVKLTFDLDVSAHADVVVMSYKNNTWSEIVSVTNNGDGTVTCVFEDFCPVAIAIPDEEYTPPAQTGDPSNVILWVALMAVSAGALVTVVVLKRKIVR